jgi:gliding motility-associated-like protein
MVRNYAFLRDTLIMGTDDFVSIDTLEIQEDIYTNFSAPSLILLDTFFCPQDPIMATLDGFVPGATSYIWSTGETTQTIEVFEEGDYAVTVTVGERVCFALCDTANITQRDFPEAMIDANFSALCELGTIGLTASSSTDLTSVLWSTGETSSIITASGPGLYSVTITDSCENTASADITFDDNSFDTSFEAVINNATSPNCSNGVSFIRLSSSHDSEFPIISYLWSTGETNEFILVSEPGTYTLTITNFCGDEFVASTNVSVDELDTSFGAGIDAPSDPSCNGGTPFFVLTAQHDSDFPINSIVWSSGEMTNFIVATETGNYSVTITNDCGDTSSASTTLSESDFDTPLPSVQIVEDRDSCGFDLTAVVILGGNVQGNGVGSYLWSNGQTTEVISPSDFINYGVTVTDNCGNSAEDNFDLNAPDDALQFPNWFNPSGSAVHPENRQFGPFIACPEFFIGNNYSLKIFNRFGNNVFETNNLSVKWNGTYKGDSAPRDVYMYQWSYDLPNGDTQSGEGHITLYR